MWERQIKLYHKAGLFAALDGEMRAQLTVSTKVSTHPDRPHAYGTDDVRWCYENSRQILGPIDIVFVHDPSSDTDMDVIMGPGGALEVLEELPRGEIRAIGLGNRTHRWQRRHHRQWTRPTSSYLPTTTIPYASPRPHSITPMRPMSAVW